MKDKEMSKEIMAPTTTSQVQAGVDGIEEGMTHSQCLAVMATRSSLTAITMQSYGGGGDGVETMDLMAELKKAGNEVASGDLTRIEKMLTNQAIVLDNMFNSLAQRSLQQDGLKGTEVFLRLALKAQAQSRATAEALAVIKNPAPYIRQANIAQGHQQVNNTYANAPRLTDAPPRDDFSQQYAPARARTKIVQSAPNKLLEADHGQRLDTRAPSAAGRADQGMETVGAVHRSKKRGRQGHGGG